MPRAIGSEHRQNATRAQRSCQIPSATRDQVAVAMELGRNNRCFGTGPPRQAGKRLEYSPLSAPPMAAAFDGAVGGHAKQPRVGAALAIVGLPYGERRLACGRPFLWTQWIMLSLSRLAGWGFSAVRDAGGLGATRTRRGWSPRIESSGGRRVHSSRFSFRLSHSGADCADQDNYAELSRGGFDLESGRPSFGRGGFCCAGSGLNTIWTFNPSNSFKILLN
jgi:hypothetical protein